jgi:hypothetical protein
VWRSPFVWDRPPLDHIIGFRSQLMETDMSETIPNPGTRLAEYEGALRLKTFSNRFDIPYSTVSRDAKTGRLKTIRDANGVDRVSPQAALDYLTACGKRTLKGQARRAKELAERRGESE